MLCEKEKCFNPLRGDSGEDFYFKNYADLYNQKIKELSDKLAKKIRKENSDGANKIRKDIDELASKQKKLEAIDSVVAPSYWAVLGLSAVGANALAFVAGIAEDTLWQNNKRTLADLFIHGSAVKVTKDELIDLFSIIAKQVPARVDVEVQSYLFGI